MLTVNDRVAGDASVLPAASMARTDTVWAPSVSAPSSTGWRTQPRTPESTLHWNVEPPSDAENPNVGVLSVVVAVGPESIVVSGAVVSAGGGGGVEPTVIALTVVSVSPSASVTVTRTFLTPSPWKVNVIVLPLPSGHCAPPGPSGPSSTQV